MIPYYIIMNEDLGGGSIQYIKDSIPFYTTIRTRKELFSIKEEHFILVLQHLIDLNLSLQDILEFYKERKCKIILPIHEWYWISYQNKKYNHIPLLEKRHNLYVVEDSLEITEKVKELFSICHKILCPSLFIYNYIKDFSKNIMYSPWKDLKISLTEKPFIFPIFKTIHIGILHHFTKYKGKEEILKIIHHFPSFHYKQKKYQIKYFIVGRNIPYYKDNLEDYLLLIQKYKIHGLFHLNQWGETFSYGLTKSLLSGIPIFYNNYGSYYERIPRDYKKYQIHHNDEKDYNNLKDNKIIDFFSYLIENQLKSPFPIYKYFQKQIEEKEYTNDYWNSSSHRIGIILTSTVFINSHKSVIYQRDPKERIKTYLKSFRQWIKHTNFFLTIVDNSGYTFPELNEYKKEKRLEVISFHEKNIPEIRNIHIYHSKGWSEGYSIQYAFKNSKNLKFCNFIIKITGRYFINELEEYLYKFPVWDYDIFTQEETERCELLGCHPKHFFELFHLDYRNENGRIDYHVENIYQYRSKKYKKRIPSKKFRIDNTQQGGLNKKIDYL